MNISDIGWITKIDIGHVALKYNGIQQVVEIPSQPLYLATLGMVSWKKPF